MYDWLIYVSSAMIILGYIPEIVQNVKNKNATFDSLPIWIIWILSSIIGIVYCMINKEYTVIINFTITGILNTLVFLIKLYYAVITSQRC